MPRVTKPLIVASEEAIGAEVSSWTQVMLLKKTKVEMVRLLSAQGADVDTENKQGLTPLMVAVRDEKPKVVEALLELGAEEDVENAMEFARVERSFDMMKLLQPYTEEQEEDEDEEGHGEL